MMAWWKLLLMLLVVAALGLLVWLEPGKQVADTRPPLTGINVDELREITITQGEQELELSKESGRWRVRWPKAVDAEPNRVAGIIQWAAQPVIASYAASADDLGRYGLQSPVLTLRFNDTELLLGDKDPIYGRRYVLVGNTVHLVEDTWYKYLTDGLPGVASHRLLPPGTTLSQLQLPDFNLTKTPDDHWLMEPPGDVSQKTLTDFVEIWQAVRAIDVRADNDEEGRPVTLTTTDGQTITMQIIIHGNQTTLRREDLGLIYHLSSVQTDLLNLPPAAQPPE